MLKRAEIQIRDPFILKEENTQQYFLFGTTDPDPWKEKGIGFDTYRSRDLENWEGPFPAFRPQADFWGRYNFWAPEVHFYRDNYYMFASFKAENVCRGTQILKSTKPEGPYTPHSSGPLTPENWECLDGTLHIDGQNAPWMIFCHEWVQVNDGEILAIRLSEDLRQSSGDPVLLFKASAARWSKSLPRRDGTGLVDAHVTDGPFVYRTPAGTLYILWSSLAATGYALGAARSLSGTLEGPWVQSEDPVLASDGGHGMVFTSFDNETYLTFHSPNTTPRERFQYAKIREKENTLIIEVKS